MKRKIWSTSSRRRESGFPLPRRGLCLLPSALCLARRSFSVGGPSAFTQKKPLRHLAEGPNVTHEKKHCPYQFKCSSVVTLYVMRSAYINCSYKTGISLLIPGSFLLLHSYSSLFVYSFVRVRRRGSARTGIA